MSLAYNTPHSRVGLLRVNLFEVLFHRSLNGNFLCGACEGRGRASGREKMRKRVLDSVILLTFVRLICVNCIRVFNSLLMNVLWVICISVLGCVGVLNYS